MYSCDQAISFVQGMKEVTKDTLPTEIAKIVIARSVVTVRDTNAHHQAMYMLSSPLDLSFTTNEFIEMMQYLKDTTPLDDWYKYMQNKLQVNHINCKL
ncbi:MAG: hypothetical protein P4L16_04140 [Chlamydiales bacterium]|nr:hypothetical protein [Chlamydiales bacterium]